MLSSDNDNLMIIRSTNMNRSFLSVFPERIIDKVCLHLPFWRSAQHHDFNQAKLFRSHVWCGDGEKRIRWLNANWSLFFYSFYFFASCDFNRFVGSLQIGYVLWCNGTARIIKIYKVYDDVIPTFVIFSIFFNDFKVQTIENSERYCMQMFLSFISMMKVTFHTCICETKSFSFLLFFETHRKAIVDTPLRFNV